MRPVKPVTVYLVFDGSTPIAFVTTPGLRGLWIRTHGCVAVSPCEYCKAMIGEPCRSVQGPRSQTHYKRRAAAKEQLKALRGTSIVISLPLPVVAV